MNEGVQSLAEEVLGNLIAVTVEMGQDGPDSIPEKARVHMMRATNEEKPVQWIMRALREKRLKRVAIDLYPEGGEVATMLCAADCELAAKTFFIKGHHQPKEHKIKLILCMICLCAPSGIPIETAPKWVTDFQVDAADDNPMKGLRE